MPELRQRFSRILSLMKTWNHLMRVSVATAVVSALLMWSSAPAATIDVEKNTITLGGTLNDSDVDQLRTLLSGNTAISTIVFDNCLGGIVRAGYNIAELIRTTGLDTVAKHQCHSSCAYAFLAGRSRRFDDTLGTHYILLHAGRNISPDQDAASTVNPALMRYLSRLTEGKLTPQAKALIEKSTSESQGLVFISNNYVLFNSLTTVYCDGSENGDVNKCKRVENADPFSLGVLKRSTEIKQSGPLPR